MRSMVFLLWVACDLASPPAIPAPPPPFDVQVWMGPWVPGEPAEIRVRDAVPFDPLFLAIGTPGRTCPPQLQGRCADVLPSTVLSLGAADAQGALTAAPRLPSTLVPGLRLRAQLIGGLSGTPYVSVPWDREVASGCPGGAPEACNLLGNAQVDSWLEPFDADRRLLPLRFAGFMDVDGDPSSGSVRGDLLYNTFRTSANQCVPVIGGQRYRLSGWGYREDNGATTDFLFAEYIFYDDDRCEGTLVGFDESPWDYVGGTWRRQTIPDLLAPFAARSALVGVGIGASFGTIGYFDDIVFTQR